MNILRKIVDVLNIRDSANTWTVGENGICRNGVDVPGWGSLRAERTHLSQWRSVPTGKTRISLNGFGYCSTGYAVPGSSLPERKDGTHDYDKAARHIIDYVRYNDKRNEEAQTSAQNTAYTKALIDKFGHGLANVSASRTKVGCVDIQVNVTSLNMAQADELMTLLLSFRK